MSLKHFLLAATTVVSGLTMPGVTSAACDVCSGCGTETWHGISEDQTVDQHCYIVERKKVCVPCVHLPGQRCRKTNCGRVRTVHVLHKAQYDCGHCGCSCESNHVNESRGSLVQNETDLHDRAASRVPQPAVVQQVAWWKRLANPPAAKPTKPSATQAAHFTISDESSSPQSQQATASAESSHPRPDRGRNASMEPGRRRAASSAKKWR